MAARAKRKEKQPERFCKAWAAMRAKIVESLGFRLLIRAQQPRFGGRDPASV